MNIKKFLLILALLFSLSVPAFAQETHGQSDRGHEDKQAKQERQFQERKERAEKNIRDNIAKEQERLSCIDRARGPESFKNCFPPPKLHHDECHR